MTTPLIAHVIHHLVIGGLENGLVNLINRIPSDEYRHAIICIDDYSDFSNRIHNNSVDVFAIKKKPGRDYGAQMRLFKLLKSIKPTILHSRNLSGLNALLPAMLAGVNIRIHGEHGRDTNDLDGRNKKLQLIRRLHSPLIQHYIPLSKDLEKYLQNQIGIRSNKITQIYNGVDTDKFKPEGNEKVNWSALSDKFNDDSIIIGTVGRFQPVKDQMNLAEGFIRLLSKNPELEKTARLVMLGDGSEYKAVLDRIKASGYQNLTWIPGATDDVANFLPGFDIFVLPSLAEGISNTILEAMACGLPVIATEAGGNPELVENGETGVLVPASNPDAIANQLEIYIKDETLRKKHGAKGRIRIENKFSLDAMVNSYLSVYDRILQRA
ncbi:MAG: TIGR03088 family PEP-CTERM/XrtA system glycosyltransferase [Sedimenticola sp.]|nr:TIGR03088 family PEP-CTERM/XrtA system glycosyltransferase [Sedimenticola sp.]